MDKKGVELSVNVIIIAAIALIVLVVLAFLVLRQAGILTLGTSCEGVGNVCMESCDAEEGYRVDVAHQCTKEQAEAGYGTCCYKLPG